MYHHHHYHHHHHDVHTHLRDYGGLVDVSAVAPPIYTALLLQVGEVDIPVRKQSLSREISDHIQPVSAASLQPLFPMHHLTVTMTQTVLVLLVTFLFQ